MAKQKRYYREYYGEEITSKDYEPVDMSFSTRKIYLCGSGECYKEFNQDMKDIEEEIQERAREDNYSRYW